MITYLSSYIQFLAAIYVTICIDSLICRRFWSPDYYNLVTRKLAVFDNSISTPKRKRLEQQIHEKEHMLDSRSRKRGAIMFTFCLLLLWYIGFEKPYTQSTFIARNIPLASLCFLTFVSLLSCKWISRRWRYTLLVCICLSLAFAILILFISDLSIESSCWLNWLGFTKRAITVLVLLPIFYQLYVNWLYSKAYIIYLDSNINDEYKRYTCSKKGFEEKDETLVDPSYDSAFRKILLKKMEGDNAMTELNNLLYEHLCVCCNPPGPIKILNNWWHNRNVDNDSPIDVELEEYERANSEDDIIRPVKSIDTLSIDPSIVEKYKKYKKIKPIPKLTDFCKSENVDEEAFRSYYNLQKSKEFREVGLRRRKK